MLENNSEFFQRLGTMQPVTTSTNFMITPHPLLPPGPSLFPNLLHQTPQQRHEQQLRALMMNPYFNKSDLKYPSLQFQLPSLSMQPPFLPLPAVSSVQPLSSGLREPPTKKFAVDSLNVDDKCPSCAQTLLSKHDYDSHVCQEQEALRLSHKRILEQLTVDKQRLEEEESKLADFHKASISREDTFGRIQSAHNSRIRDKGNFFRVIGKRSPTADNNESEDQKSVSSGSTTPNVSADGFNALNSPRTGSLVCRCCQKTGKNWKISDICEHLLCASCWDDALLQENPVCPRCHSSVKEGNLTNFVQVAL